MGKELFIISLSLICSVLLWWGCARLTGAGWQIIAAVPVREKPGGIWTGVNFTYYGFILAGAQCIAVTLFCILMGSLGYSLAVITFPVSIMIGICLPASRIMASVVEKKRNTFTVGGASFAGFILAPAVVAGVNAACRVSIGTMPFLAALAASYAIGEGIGRLGCISFGCCYGRHIYSCHPFIRSLFIHFHFRFSGKLKKITYEGKLDGEPVVPVQAVTSIVNCLAGVLSVYMFLNGNYRMSFLVAVVTTQGWRFISEFLRADHRGENRISCYQVMSLAMVMYSFLIVLCFESGSVLTTEIGMGLKTVMTVPYVLFIEILWIVMFVYLGKSRVTGSEILLFVHKDRI